MSQQPTIPNVLQVGGYTMRVGDGDAYWALTKVAPCFIQRDCLENGDASPITGQNVLWADIIVCYSWGVPSVVKTISFLIASRLWPAGKTIRLIVIAGVPDSSDGESYDGNVWKYWGFVEKAVTFQVNGAIPASVPNYESDALWLQFTADMDIPDARRVNLDATALMQAAIFDVPLPLQCVAKHTRIKDNPDILAAVQDLLKRWGAM